LAGLSPDLRVLTWVRGYDRACLGHDLIAALTVTVMLIPQSLAYALLAGLPPQAGLYASIAPLVAYAIFGGSRSLAVGPVAVVSLMTAAAVGHVAEAGEIGYAAAALTLAFLSGVLLLIMGWFRLGFIANFLSYPVISGFITASGLLIAAGQLKHLLGLPAEGQTLVELGVSLWRLRADVDGLAVMVGGLSLFFLLGVRFGPPLLLHRFGLAQGPMDLLAKAAPAFIVIVSIIAVKHLDLTGRGLAVVGETPSGPPPFTLPGFDPGLIGALLGSAVLISMIGFVESVSIARTLATKNRERINPDQELAGLGAANLAAAFSGGYPVSGGFARSAVNHNAGARTPAAGGLTALGVLIVTMFFTPLIRDLPVAVLAATIMMAVLSLVDLGALNRAWAYSKADFSAMAVTIALTLLLGVETGVISGVILSLVLFLYRTSRPHTAVVGRVEGGEHFRNVERHTVITHPHILTLRVDESLYFANARYLEDRIYALASQAPQLRHFILMCPAVNGIDMSALASLEAINARLADAGIKLHLSEVKGPVMDRLKRSHFLESLTGSVFLSQHEAFESLSA